MRHGSLFSGIGGFDLAASWVGWQNIFQVEIDPFCRRILKAHFIDTNIFEDIRKFKGGKYYGTIDIISGGFPCQPFSIAGQRLGSSDDRYLWPEMLRIIDEIRPAWVVGENVIGILSMVQPGMSINLGSQTDFLQEDHEILTEYEYLIHTICNDFDRIGYSVQPFIIPACSTGAPHLRNRIWFVACSNDKLRRQKESKKEHKNTGDIQPGFKTVGAKRIITNPYSEGLERTPGEILQRANGQLAWFNQIPDWTNWPIESPICRRDDGISQSLVNISFSKWRKDGIHAFGNAIVPQAAYQIFSAINSINN